MSLNTLAITKPRYNPSTDLNRVYAVRLLKLAELLETLPKSRFYFGTYFSVPEGKSHSECSINDCGTTACALGWSCVFPFARKLGFGRAYTVANEPGLASKTLYGEEFYSPGYRSMFLPDSYPVYPGQRSLHSNASAADVAGNIRAFVMGERGYTGPSSKPQKVTGHPAHKR